MSNASQQMAPSPIGKSLAIQVDGPPRVRDRSKKTLMEVVKLDMRKYNLFGYLVSDK